MAHCNDGPCGNIRSYAVVSARLSIFLGELRNRCRICLHIGDWYGKRLVDRSRMNWEIHVRLREGLRGKLPWSTRPCSLGEFVILARCHRFWNIHLGLLSRPPLMPNVSLKKLDAIEIWENNQSVINACMQQLWVMLQEFLIHSAVSRGYQGDWNLHGTNLRWIYKQYW